MKNLSEYDKISYIQYSINFYGCKGEDMKREVKLSEISKKLGLSKSTVCKALNNKAGVDKNTKDTVIKCARKMGYLYENSDSEKVFVLLPLRCRELCKYFQDAFAKKGITAKCAVYLNDTDYMQNLLLIAKSSYDIVIVYPCAGQDVQVLKRIAKKSAVWFTGDVVNIENTFYFGLNPIKEAEMIAQKFLCSNKKRPVFIQHGSEAVSRKILGIFAGILKENGIKPAYMLNFDEKDLLSAPIMARKLGRIDSFDSVYCNKKDLTYVGGALKKLGKGDLPVFCVDEIQNLKLASDLAAENAKKYIDCGEYPMCKYLFV